MITLADIKNQYNNIAKTRRLMLEEASKEIVRYYAGKQDSERLGNIYSEMLSPESGTPSVENILNRSYLSISEPYTIKKILSELSQQGVKEEGMSSKIDIIYNKNILDEVFSGISDYNDTSGHLGDNETVRVNDIKVLIGNNFISNSAFNNADDLQSMNPDRFRDPQVAVFKVKNNNASFQKTKESAFAPILATMIPATELSKCTPHLSVTIIDGDTDIDNSMSIGKFLVGRGEFRSDGFARSIARSTLEVKQDEAFNQIRKLNYGTGRTLKASGMELFQSPQAMVNGDINKFQSESEKVTNPFRPLMSIESFSINDNLVGYELLSTSKATLSLKLYDRTRLPEISKLVAVHYLATVFLIIEWGWNHPDGSIVSKNSFGKFMNALKRRESFKVNDSKVTINDDGTVSISLDLISLGSGSENSSGQSQKFLPVAKFNEYVKELERKLKSYQADGVDVNRFEFQGIEITVLEKNKFNSNDLILREALENIEVDGKKVSFFKEFDEIIRMPKSESLINIQSRIRSLMLAVDEDVLNYKPVQTESEDTSGIDEDKKSESRKTEEEIKQEEKRQKEIEEEKIQSSTRTVISSLVKFIQYGDGFINQGEVVKGFGSLPPQNTNPAGTGLESLQSGFGTSFVDSFQASLPGDAGKKKQLDSNRFLNDVSTVLSRLVLVQDPGTDIMESYKKTFSYQLKRTIEEKGGKESALVIDEFTDSPVKSYITLGRLLTYVYALPSALEMMTHDETQIFFHPANSQAGAFYNISLGDVFISTKRYLDSVSRFLQKNEVSTLKVETHLNIISNILKSNDYEIGYGISTLNTDVDNGGQNLTEEQKKIRVENYLLNQNDKLKRIYGSESGETGSNTLNFRNINLKVIEKTQEYLDGSDVKRIRKIHFYDHNNEPFKDEKILLSALSSTNLESVLLGDVNPVSLLNGNVDLLKFTRNFNKKNKKNDSWINKNLNEVSILNVTSKRVVNKIEEIIKSNVPTIEFGTDSGFVQSISLSNTNGSTAVDINLRNNLERYYKPQDEDRSSPAKKLFVNPGSLSISMLGCPIFSIGQKFYVTAKTNTMLDNIYIVQGISHSVSEGNFLTTLSLQNTNDARYLPENITNRIVNIVKSIDENSISPL